MIPNLPARPLCGQPHVCILGVAAPYGATGENNHEWLAVPQFRILCAVFWACDVISTTSFDDGRMQIRRGLSGRLVGGGMLRELQLRHEV